MIPASVGRTLTVTLSGGDVEIRGLTVGEMRGVRDYRVNGVPLSSVESDARYIALATGDPIEHVTEWISQASAGDVMRLLAGIYDASGMSEGAQFPGAAAGDAVPAPAAE